MKTESVCRKVFIKILRMQNRTTEPTRVDKGGSAHSKGNIHLVLTRSSSSRTIWDGSVAQQEAGFPAELHESGELDKQEPTRFVWVRTTTPEVLLSEPSPGAIGSFRTSSSVMRNTSC